MVPYGAPLRPRLAGRRGVCGSLSPAPRLATPEQARQQDEATGRVQWQARRRSGGVSPRHRPGLSLVLRSALLHCTLHGASQRSHKQSLLCSALPIVHPMDMQPRRHDAAVPPTLSPPSTSRLIVMSSGPEPLTPILPFITPKRDAGPALTHAIRSCTSWHQLRALLLQHDRSSLNALHVTAAISCCARRAGPGALQPPRPGGAHSPAAPPTHPSARQGPGGNSPVGQQAGLREFLDGLLLPAVLRQLGDMGPRELRTVVHGLGAMGHCPGPAWLGALLARVQLCLPLFKARDAAGLVWGLSRMGGAGGRGEAADGGSSRMVWQGVTDTFNLYEGRDWHESVAADGSREGGGAQGGGRGTAGGGALGAEHRALLSRVVPELLGHCAQLLPSSNDQDLSNMAVGFAKLHALLPQAGLADSLQHGRWQPASEPAGGGSSRDSLASLGAIGGGSINTSSSSSSMTTNCKDQDTVLHGGSSSGPGPGRILGSPGQFTGGRSISPPAALSRSLWVHWRQQLLLCTQYCMPQLGPQALANIAHALTRLPGPLPPPAWRTAFQQAVSRQLGQCTPHALSTFVWACPLLGWPPGCCWAQQLLVAVQGRLGDCSAEDLVDVGLVLPQLVLPPARGLQHSTGGGHADADAAVEIEAGEGSTGSREGDELAAGAGAAAAAGSGPELEAAAEGFHAGQWLHAYQDAWLDRLLDASPPQLALLLTALSRCTRCGLPPPRPAFLSSWLRASTPLLPRFTPTDLAQALSALAALRACPPPAWQALALGAVRPQLPGAAPGDLALLLWSMSQLRVRPGWQWTLDLFSCTAEQLARCSEERGGGGGRGGRGVGGGGQPAAVAGGRGWGPAEGWQGRGAGVVGGPGVGLQAAGWVQRGSAQQLRGPGSGGALSPADLPWPRPDLSTQPLPPWPGHSLPPPTAQTAGRAVQLAVVGSGKALSPQLPAAAAVLGEGLQAVLPPLWAAPTPPLPLPPPRLAATAQQQQQPRRQKLVVQQEFQWSPSPPPPLQPVPPPSPLQPPPQLTRQQPPGPWGPAWASSAEQPAGHAVGLLPPGGLQPRWPAAPTLGPPPPSPAAPAAATQGLPRGSRPPPLGLGSGAPPPPPTSPALTHPQLQLQPQGPVMPASWLQVGSTRGSSQGEAVVMQWGAAPGLLGRSALPMPQPHPHPHLGQAEASSPGLWGRGGGPRHRGEGGGEARAASQVVQPPRLSRVQGGGRQAWGLRDTSMMVAALARLQLQPLQLWPLNLLRHLDLLLELQPSVPDPLRLTPTLPAPSATVPPSPSPLTQTAGSALPPLALPQHSAAHQAVPPTPPGPPGHPGRVAVGLPPRPGPNLLLLGQLCWGLVRLHIVVPPRLVCRWALLAADQVRVRAGCQATLLQGEGQGQGSQRPGLKGQGVIDQQVGVQGQGASYAAGDASGDLLPGDPMGRAGGKADRQDPRDQWPAHPFQPAPGETAGQGQGGASASATTSFPLAPGQYPGGLLLLWALGRLAQTSGLLSPPACSMRRKGRLLGALPPRLRLQAGQRRMAPLQLGWRQWRPGSRGQAQGAATEGGARQGGAAGAQALQAPPRLPPPPPAAAALPGGRGVMGSAGLHRREAAAAAPGVSPGQAAAPPLAPESLQWPGPAPVERHTQTSSSAAPLAAPPAAIPYPPSAAFCGPEHAETQPFPPQPMLDHMQSPAGQKGGQGDRAAACPLPPTPPRPYTGQHRHMTGAEPLTPGAGQQQQQQQQQQQAQQAQQQQQQQRPHRQQQQQQQQRPHRRKQFNSSLATLTRALLLDTAPYPASADCRSLQLSVQAVQQAMAVLCPHSHDCCPEWEAQLQPWLTAWLAAYTPLLASAAAGEGNGEQLRKVLAPLPALVKLLPAVTHTAAAATPPQVQEGQAEAQQAGLQPGVGGSSSSSSSSSGGAGSCPVASCHMPPQLTAALRTWTQQAVRVAAKAVQAQSKPGWQQQAQPPCRPGPRARPSPHCSVAEQVQLVLALTRLATATGQVALVWPLLRPVLQAVAHWIHNFQAHTRQTAAAAATAAKQAAQQPGNSTALTSSPHPYASNIDPDPALDPAPKAPLHAAQQGLPSRSVARPAQFWLEPVQPVQLLALGLAIQLHCSDPVARQQLATDRRMKINVRLLARMLQQMAGEARLLPDPAMQAVTVAKALSVMASKRKRRAWIVRGRLTAQNISPKLKWQ